MLSPSIPLSAASATVAITEAGPCQGGLQGLNPCSSWAESPVGCEAQVSIYTQGLYSLLCLGIAQQLGKQHKKASASEVHPSAEHVEERIETTALVAPVQPQDVSIQNTP